jgi:hypothetical protein
VDLFSARALSRWLRRCPGLARLIPTDEDLDQHRGDFKRCVCGCGRWTQRRYHPGCDSGFYKRLRVARAKGDDLAGFLYDFMFKNNRRSSYPAQRYWAKLWRESQVAEGTSI